MKKPLLAALVLIPLLAAPALAAPMLPKLKAPVAECVGQTPADCATIHQVPYRR
jgi:hypothetical protein